ncbi:MAG TPA: SDR family oxidoreductase [Polyangia bacterium]|jgi:NAD(P)-dependent dehydrogenase (short-subunit alcohol dehydrogenase family)
MGPSSAIVIGGGSGIGRATVRALATGGVRVWAVGRDPTALERMRKEATGPGEVLVRALDATDAAATERLLAEVDPDLVVLTAGVRARLAPVHEQSWESFSAPWNADVKMAFQLGQSALRHPLRPGSLVVIVSSGAGLGGSPLSGGYAGAKRTQMFLAGYLQRSADAAKLGIRFLALVPKQILPETELGALAADAYAAAAGITREKFMERFGKLLTVDDVARTIVGVARGELAREGSVLGVSGGGTELL